MPNHKIVADGLLFPEGPVACCDGSGLLVEIQHRTVAPVSPAGEKTTAAEPGSGFYFTDYGKLYPRFRPNGGLHYARANVAYRGWGSELTAELTLIEAGMARFAATDKDYVGKAGVDARRAAGALPYRLAYLELEPGDAEVLGNEPVYAAGEIAGVTTSGGYGHWVGKSLAFAYVKPALAEIGTALEIAVLGRRRKAKVIAEPVYDPGNERSRG